MSQAGTAWYVRAWRALRGFVAGLFGPSDASDAITRNQGNVHPRIDLRGRTMNGGNGP